MSRPSRFGIHGLRKDDLGYFYEYKEEGKKSVSEYMRELALSRGPNMWNKVIETHAMVEDLYKKPDLKSAINRLMTSVNNAEIRLKAMFRNLETKK